MASVPSLIFGNRDNQNRVLAMRVGNRLKNFPQMPDSWRRRCGHRAGDGQHVFESLWIMLGLAALAWSGVFGMVSVLERLMR
jgi:hypothetical protein